MSLIASPAPSVFTPFLLQICPFFGYIYGLPTIATLTLKVETICFSETFISTTVRMIDLTQVILSFFVVLLNSIRTTNSNVLQYYM